MENVYQGQYLENLKKIEERYNIKFDGNMSLQKNEQS